MPVRWEELSGGPPSVLIVTDDEMTCLLLRRVLRDAGIAAEVAATVAEAVDLAASGDIAVAFIDLDMGAADGLEALRLTRDTTPIRYAFTGRLDAEWEERALALGAAGVLTKPVDPEELARLARFG
ncbi:MAG TPA: response regulator [Armatimonadota bacterium]